MVWNLYFFVFRFRFWGVQNVNTTIKGPCRRKRRQTYTWEIWLIRLFGEGVFWFSQGYEENSIFSFSFFFFLEIFQKYFSLNCRPSKLQCSEDNCLFFQWLRILSCLQGHRSGHFECFCLINICTSCVCVWKIRGSETQKERKRNGEF